MLTGWQWLGKCLDVGSINRGHAVLIWRSNLVAVTALTEIRRIYAECWRETLHRGVCTVGVKRGCKRRAEIRFSAEEKDFSVFHNFQTGSVATQPPGALSPWKRGQGVKLITHHLVPRSGIVELHLCTPLHLHGLCLIKDRVSFPLRQEVARMSLSSVVGRFADPCSHV